MDRVSLVQQVHQAVGNILKPGDTAIDATVGNGHDTLFLATQVGESGKVYGFDIQEAALDSAYRRLEAANQSGQVSLYRAGHEVMTQLLPKSVIGKVQAVVFNLGYLPGGDKLRTTSSSTRRSAGAPRPRVSPSSPTRPGRTPATASGPPTSRRRIMSPTTCLPLSNGWKCSHAASSRRHNSSARWPPTAQSSRLAAPSPRAATGACPAIPRAPPGWKISPG